MDSNPHGIPSKNEKKIAPSKKVQQNCKANEMLSKINLSYTPTINFASFISNTHNLTHCGRVTQICVSNTVKLGTSASSP